MLEGIIVADSDGQIKSVNPAAESLFRTTASDLVGRNVAVLMPEPDQSHHNGYLSEYNRTGQVHILGKSREVVGVRRDGSLFPMEIAVNVMETGRRRMFVSAVHDISERKILEEKLNARMSELEMSYSTIKQDIESAARLQRSRLPSPSLCLGGLSISSLYLPSTTLSGDLFGYFEIPEDIVVLYSVDVSGHGVPAALLAVTLSHTLTPEFFARIPAPQTSTPDGGRDRLSRIVTHTLARLNARFQIDQGTCQYFTIGLCVIDLGHRMLAFGQAGHPSLLMVRADGSVMSIGSGGVPIGFLSEADYDPEIVSLTPGDRLALITDGVTECLGINGEEFGEERLQALLQKSVGSRLDSLPEVIKQTLTNWKGGSGFHDDISIILIDV